MSTPTSEVRDEQDAVARRTPPLRFVTAASLFDGHDAAINVMRRLIQGTGAEVVHLGHNRSVADVVRAAIQEDADAIAVSSYQGGHLEYFTYAVDMLRDQGAGHIRVFGGGGGTITAAEVAQLEAYGVERVYLPADGLRLGLEGMIADLVERTSRARLPSGLPEATAPASDLTIARTLSALEDDVVPAGDRDRLRDEWAAAGSRASRSSASRAPAGPARAPSPTSSSPASCSTSRTRGSPCWPSTRRGAARVARCSATGSG